MNKKDLIAYIMSKRGAVDEYPFGPEAQVFKVVGKMFALVPADPDTHTVTLKCDPDHALILREVYADDVKPGYHMNKRHWNTVTINGKVPDDELCEMVDESYDLVVAGLKKAARDKLLADKSE